MSLKVVPLSRSCMVSYSCSFFSNCVPKTHRFWDIRLQNCRDLENRVRGPSTSLELSRSIECIWLPIDVYGSTSCRFWDIQCRKMSWPWNRGQRSFKVIESCTMR